MSGGDQLYGERNDDGADDFTGTGAHVPRIAKGGRASGGTSRSSEVRSLGRPRTRPRYYARPRCSAVCGELSANGFRCSKTGGFRPRVSQVGEGARAHDRESRDTFAGAEGVKIVFERADVG